MEELFKELMKDEDLRFIFQVIAYFIFGQGCWVIVALWIVGILCETIVKYKCKDCKNEKNK